MYEYDGRRKDGGPGGAKTHEEFLRAQEDAEAAQVLAEMDEADMAEADAYYASVDPLPVYRRLDAGGERKWWLYQDVSYA